MDKLGCVVGNDGENAVEKLPGTSDEAPTTLPLDTIEMFDEVHEQLDTNPEFMEKLVSFFFFAQILNNSWYAFYFILHFFPQIAYLHGILVTKHKEKALGGVISRLLSNLFSTNSTGFWSWARANKNDESYDKFIDSDYPQFRVVISTVSTFTLYLINIIF